MSPGVSRLSHDQSLNALAPDSPEDTANMHLDASIVATVNNSLAASLNVNKRNTVCFNPVIDVSVLSDEEKELPPAKRTRNANRIDSDVSTVSESSVNGSECSDSLVECCSPNLSNSEEDEDKSSKVLKSILKRSMLDDTLTEGMNDDNILRGSSVVSHVTSPCNDIVLVDESTVTFDQATESIPSIDLNSKPQNKVKKIKLDRKCFVHKESTTKSKVINKNVHTCEGTEQICTDGTSNGTCGGSSGMNGLGNGVRGKSWENVLKTDTEEKGAAGAAALKNESRETGARDGNILSQVEAEEGKSDAAESTGGSDAARIHAASDGGVEAAEGGGGRATREESAGTGHPRRAAAKIVNYLEPSRIK